MSIVITRLFDTYAHAEQAVSELEASGVPHTDISLVANNSDGRYGDSVDGTAGVEGTVGAETLPFGTPATGTTGVDADSTAHGAGTGATVGTVLGGGAGLLAGLGLLAIPGVGPVVAAGWLVATALGAGVGAASGGLIGSLVGAGVHEDDAHVYAEGVRRGGTLVTVRVDEARGPAIEQLLAKHSSVDTSTRADEYRKGGWSRFDEQAPAYTAGGSPSIGTTPPVV